MSENTELEVAQSFIQKAQNFWNKNQKIIFGVIGGAAVLVGGIWAYNQFVVKPKNEKAAEALYKAEEYFAQDSSRKVLDGDGTTKGVLYVIKNFGGTPSANLAHYYAGISYLKLGEFNKAVEQLKDFSTDSKPVQMTAYGAMADAYSELGKTEDAVSYYKKAAAHFPENETFAAELLFRAGQLCELKKKDKEALELYKEIKNKFPKIKGTEIDKYIYKLSIEKNDFSVK